MLTARRCLWTIAAALGVLVGGHGSLWGYAFLSPVANWPAGIIVMNLQLGDSSGTLVDGSTSWGSVFEGALATWNASVSQVQFGVYRDSTAPIGDGNYINNVFWSSTVYGRTFGTNTLAITTSWRIGSTKTEADVIFNNGFTWDSYRGPLRRASSGSRIYDFRRVALHEAGHVLGLDHPDDHGQSVSAQMNSTVSDLDSLTVDDTSGAQALYQGLSVVQPGAPRGLIALVSGSTVMLAWAAPTTGGAPTGYVLDVGSASGLSNQGTYSVGLPPVSFSGVPAGVYYARLRGTNSVGTSSPSNEVILAVPSSCSVPTAPNGLQVLSIVGSTVILNWNAASGGPATYILEAGSQSGASNLANADLGGTATSLTAYSVGRGTYFVRVRSRNACGTSPASNEIVVVVS